MMDWKTYINDRLIAQHPDGFYVIKPAEYSSSAQPLFCPVCSGIMRTSYDEESYKKFSCCDKCANRFVYPDIDKWTKGWRPSAEDLT